MKIAPIPRHAILTAFFGAALSGFIYGYNIGVYSGAILEIQKTLNLDDVQLGNLIALFSFAEIVGVCLSFLADRYGRRRTLLFAAALMSVAPILPLLDASFATLLIARALSGIAAGYIFVVALLYVSEVSAPSTRAPMASLIMVALSAGYLVELALNANLVEGHHWRIAIAVGSVPALLQLIGLLLMKESPVHYSLSGDKARADALCAYFQVSVDPSAAEAKAGLPAMIQSLGNAHFRKQMLRGLAIVAAGTLAGHSILLQFGPVVLDFFGETEPTRALYILTIFSLLGLLCSLAALIPISKGYSQTLLLGSLAVMGVIQIVLGFASGFFAIVLLGALQLAFSFGIRTTVFQMLPSLFSDATRAVGVAFLNLVFMFIAAIDEEVLPSLFSVLGNSFFLASGILALGLAFVCRRILVDRNAD